MNKKTTQFQARIRALGPIGVEALEGGVQTTRQFDNYVYQRNAEGTTRAGERISRTQAFSLVQDIVRGLPDQFAGALLAQLVLLQPQLNARMKAGVPTRSGKRPAKFAGSRPGLRPTGGLRSLLTTRIDEKALRLSAGLLTKQAASDGFYGYILDAGRGLKRQRSKPKSRVIQISARQGRFGIVTSRETKRYTRKISPISPGKYDITFGRVRAWAREQGGPMLLKAYDAALRKALWKNQ